MPSPADPSGAPLHGRPGRAHDLRRGAGLRPQAAPGTAVAASPAAAVPVPATPLEIATRAPVRPEPPDARDRFRGRGRSPAPPPGPPPGRAGRDPWGLGLVLAVVTAVGIAPGPLRALLVAGPLSTYALPWLAAVADWRLGAGPGTGDGRRAALGPAGRVTLVAVGAAAALAGAHALSWREGPEALLPGGGPGVPPWPCLMPQGALAFVAFVQVSSVSEARSRIVALRPAVRCAAVAGCFATGAVLTALLVDWSGLGPWPGAGPRWRGGPVPAFELLTWLACAAAWQVVHGVLGGGPVARIRRRGPRVLAANAAVLGLATLTWAALRLGLGVPGPRLAAGCALVVAGGALARAGSRRPAGAAQALLLTGCYAVAVGVPLAVAAALQRWPTRTPAELWLVICGLNLVPATLLAAAGLPPRPGPVERTERPDHADDVG